MIYFLGVRIDVRTDSTDRQIDRQTRFWNPHMETCRHTKNFNSKLKIRIWLSIAICLPGGRGCIIIIISCIRVGRGGIMQSENQGRFTHRYFF